MFRRLAYLHLFLILFGAGASAQNSQVLYYMNIPQNHLLNPALRPSNSFYLGLPALTGVNVSVNSNFVNLSDIFLQGKGDSIITPLHPDYDIDSFLEKIKDRNFITPMVNIQLLGLGFTAGKDLYVSLDIVDRVSGNFVLPGDLVRLALKGNEEFLGKTIDLSSFDADFQYFREYGVGFSKDFGKNLRIGIRPKLLSGMIAFSLENNSLELTVNPDYSHTLNADLSAHFSYPFKVYFNSDNSPDSISIDEEFFGSTRFFLNTSNIGLGLDLGATYKFGERIQVSASITDLGFISWKDQPTNMNAKSNFEFSGLNITDVVDGSKTIDELAEEMIDSLKNSFIFTNDNTPFQTYLPVGVSFGGSINVTKSLSFGILTKSTFIGKQFHQAATFSGNLNIGNAFSTSISYTAANSRYDNLGAGIAFRMGVIQLYFIADRIPLTWNTLTLKSDANTRVPANWNIVNMRLGLNLVMGNKVKKKNDKPMLMEQE